MLWNPHCMCCEIYNNRVPISPCIQPPGDRPWAAEKKNLYPSLYDDD